MSVYSAGEQQGPEAFPCGFLFLGASPREEAFFSGNSASPYLWTADSENMRHLRGLQTAQRILHTVENVSFSLGAEKKNLKGSKNVSRGIPFINAM